MYAVVETTADDEEKEVSVVLEKWLINNLVYWPPNYKRAITNKLEIDDSWESFDCKVLKRNIKLFSKAKQIEKHYEVYSNSDNEKNPTRKKPKFAFSQYNEEFEIALPNLCKTVPNIESKLIEAEMPLLVPIKQIQPFQNKTNLNDIEVSDYLVLNSKPKEVSQEITSLQVMQDKEVDSASYRSPIPQKLSTLESISIDLMPEGVPVDITSDEFTTPIFRSNCFILDSESKNFNEKIQQIEDELKSIRQNQIKILENQEEMMRNQNITKECLENLLLIVRKTETKILKNKSFVLPKLPIKTVEELSTLNSKLMNKEYMEQMVIYLILNVNMYICTYYFLILYRFYTCSRIKVVTQIEP